MRKVDALPHSMTQVQKGICWAALIGALTQGLEVLSCQQVIASKPAVDNLTPRSSRPGDSVAF
tara:strand:+ start:58 stop:246 length:189 start_codon:yes stop_codon:yes gene_type:complete